MGIPVGRFTSALKPVRPEAKPCARTEFNAGASPDMGASFYSPNSFFVRVNARPCSSKDCRYLMQPRMN